MQYARDQIKKYISIPKISGIVEEFFRFQKRPITLQMENAKQDVSLWTVNESNEKHN